MDAYLRQLQRESFTEERSPLLSRYIRAMERVLGLREQTPSFEEAQEMLKFAQKLNVQLRNQLVFAAYRDVVTPENTETVITWNLPGMVRVNWYDEYPPNHEEAEISAGMQWPVRLERSGGSANFFNIIDLDDGAVTFQVPRWAFRISEEELTIFNVIRQHLPERYLPRMRMYDVPSVMGD